MKKIIIFVLMVCLTANTAFAAEEPIGKIIALVGHATATNKSTSRTLNLASDVFPKDTITTTATGKLQIMFKDDTLLSVAPETQLAIDDYVYNDDESNFLVNCTTGMLEFATGDIVKQNPDGFNFETPLNVIGIRGTVGGLIVGPISGATPPPCTAMLFHSSHPQNMSVTGKMTGATVHFSQFNQLIQQKNIQRIESPAPIPTDVLNSFRKKTTMPPRAFEKQPPRGKKRPPIQSGLSGGQPKGPVPPPMHKGQHSPEEDEPSVSETIANSATLTENTPAESDIRVTVETSSTAFEPTSSSSVYAATTVIHNDLYQTILKTNTATPYNTDIDLNSFGGSSSKITLDGTSSYSKINYALYDSGIIQEPINITINQTSYTAPTGTESYLNWGYWTASPAGTPIVPDTGSGHLDLTPVLYVVGDINNDVGSYISGTYSGDVNLLTSIDNAAHQSITSTFTAHVNVSGSTASVTDMDMATVNIGSFAGSAVSLQMENLSGAISSGQFDLTGDVAILENGVETGMSNAEIQGAMFGERGIGGTIAVDGMISDAQVQVTGVFAGSAE